MPKSLKFKQSENVLFPKKEKFHLIKRVFCPFCVTYISIKLNKIGFLKESFGFKILFEIIFIP